MRWPTDTLRSTSGATPEASDDSAERGGDGDARVVEAWIEDERGERQASVPQGQRITLKALVSFMVDVEDPAASLYVLNEDHVAIIVATTSRENERSGRFGAGEEVLFSFSFENVLAPGRYNPLFTIAHRGTGLDLMDRLEGAVSFVVTGPDAMGGLIDVPVDVSVARGQTRDHPAGTGLSSQAAPYEGLGRPIRGPRALTNDWSRFWHLTYNIARNEFKLRFFGSILGYLWQLVRPLLLFGVLYVFFTQVAQVNNQNAPGQEHYGAQLLGSIVLFTFFAEATAGAVRSVVDRENLVRKIQFPRMVIPLSVVLLATFNLALNLLVVFGFAMIEGVRPMASWLELPLILLMLAVFATGIAMLLSALFVSLRDIQPIWEVISQILFYCSPVIISVETVREKVARPCSTSTCSTRSPWSFSSSATQ